MPASSFWDRLKTRILTEFGNGTQPNAPGVDVDPDGPPTDAPPPPGLMDRLRDRIKKTVRPGPEKKNNEPAPGRDRIMWRIREAGRRHVLLLMKYHGVYRHVEPYSFRPRGQGGALRFFGWCLLHNHIEMYRPEKIEDAVLTDIPYHPRTVQTAKGPVTLQVELT